jgi:hypothetical protein
MMRVRIGLARSVADSSLAKNRLLYKNTANDFAEQIMKLTPRQQEILDFIKNTVEVCSAPCRPGRKSPAFGFRFAQRGGRSPQGAGQERCHQPGAGSARGIRLVEQLGLPLIGSVAAGSPILAVENVQARYAFDAGMFNPRADFLLKVRPVDDRCRHLRWRPACRAQDQPGRDGETSSPGSMTMSPSSACNARPGISN